MKSFINVVKPIVLVCFVVITSLGSQANASIVSFDTSPENVGLNSLFSIDLIGDNFVDIVGFGLNLNWTNAGLFNLVSADVDGTVWNFSTSNITANHVIDNTAGSVTGLGGTFFGFNPTGVNGDNIQLVTLNFAALGNIGSSTLTLTDSTNNAWLWLDSIDAINSPDYETGVINVGTAVVPLPAGIWFAFTAIASLSFFNRRRA